MDNDRFDTIKDAVRHSGVIRPGINIAPDNARHKKPRNVEFFTPDPETFDDPRDARMLLEKHADGEGHIHRLPIWLHTDDLSLVAPHGLCLFRAGGLACRALNSAGDDAGMALRFDNGERKLVKCDPDECPDHLAGDCKFSGRLYFFVRGQMSPNPLLLPTTSLNSFRMIYSALTNLKRVRGSVKGLHRGKPFLELVKVKKPVLRATDKGFTRVPQWLVSLGLSVPMDELIENAGTSAVDIPEAPASVPTADIPNESTPSVSSPEKIKAEIVEMVRRMGIDDEDMRIWAERIEGKAVRDMNPNELKSLHGMLVAAEKGSDSRLLLEIRLARVLARLNVTFDEFDAWLAADDEGLGWESAIAKDIAKDVLPAIEARAASDPNGLKQEIERMFKERSAA